MECVDRGYSPTSEVALGDVTPARSLREGKRSAPG